MSEFLLGLITFLLLVISIMVVIAGIAFTVLVVLVTRYAKEIRSKLNSFAADTNHKVDIFTARAKGYQDAVKSPAGMFVAGWHIVRKFRKSKKK